jgi:hypothetical protein
MRRFLKLLVVVALLTVPSGAGAQDIRINPVPLGTKPQWTQVPGASQVFWAPNLPTDVFRYRGNYYFFWNNFFYRGPAPQGPWKVVNKVPRVFHRVAPAYFKTASKVEGAMGSPAPPRESVMPPKGKIIEIPPEETPGQAPTEPQPAPPAGPEPPGESVTPPKVM